MKLRLNKERLRVLNRPDLEAIAGGMHTTYTTIDLLIEYVHWKLGSGGCTFSDGNPGGCWETMTTGGAQGGPNVA